jgi:hypothetical protein
VIERCERGMVHGFIQNLDQVSPGASHAVKRWHDDARELLKMINVPRPSRP